MRALLWFTLVFSLLSVCANGQQLPRKVKTAAAGKGKMKSAGRKSPPKMLPQTHKLHEQFMKDSAKKIQIPQKTKTIYPKMNRSKKKKSGQPSNPRKPKPIGRYYWQAEDKINIILRSETQQQALHKKRKKVISSNLEDPLGSVLPPDPQIILQDHLLSEFHYLPATIQEGYHWAKHDLNRRPYPLTIITIPVFQNDFLSLLLPYLSLAVDMLVVDEIHLWPYYPAMPPSNSTHQDESIVSSQSNRDMLLSELNQLLRDHNLLSSNNLNNEFIRKESRRNQSTVPYLAPKVHIFHDKSSSLLTSENKEDVDMTAFFQFYIGFGAVRREDVLLRCSDNIAFLDILRLTDLIQGMYRSVMYPWYYRNNQQQLSSSENSELSKQLPTVTPTTQKFPTPTLFLPNIINDIALSHLLYGTSASSSHGNKLSSPLPLSLYNSAKGSTSQSDEKLHFAIHQYFLQHWSTIVSLPSLSDPPLSSSSSSFSSKASSKSSSVLYGVWNRRIKRVYVSASEATIPRSDIYAAIASRTTASHADSDFDNKNNGNDNNDNNKNKESSNSKKADKNVSNHTNSKNTYNNSTTNNNSSSVQQLRRSIIPDVPSSALLPFLDVTDANSDTESDRNDTQSISEGHKTPAKHQHFIIATTKVRYMRISNNKNEHAFVSIPQYYALDNHDNNVKQTIAETVPNFPSFSGFFAGHFTSLFLPFAVQTTSDEAKRKFIAASDRSYTNMNRSLYQNSKNKDNMKTEDEDDDEGKISIFRSEESKILRAALLLYSETRSQEKKQNAVAAVSSSAESLVTVFPSLVVMNAAAIENSNYNSYNEKTVMNNNNSEESRNNRDSNDKNSDKENTGVESGKPDNPSDEGNEEFARQQRRKQKFLSDYQQLFQEYKQIIVH